MGKLQHHLRRPFGPDHLLDLPGIRNQQRSVAIHDLLGCLQAQVKGRYDPRMLGHESKTTSGVWAHAAGEGGEELAVERSFGLRG